MSTKKTYRSLDVEIYESRLRTKKLKKQAVPRKGNKHARYPLSKALTKLKKKTGVKWYTTDHERNWDDLDDWDEEVEVSEETPQAKKDRLSKIARAAAARVVDQAKNKKPTRHPPQRIQYRKGNQKFSEDVEIDEKKMIKVKLNPKKKIGYTITSPGKGGKPGKVLKRKDVPGKKDVGEGDMGGKTKKAGKYPKGWEKNKKPGKKQKTIQGLPISKRDDKDPEAMDRFHKRKGYYPESEAPSSTVGSVGGAMTGEPPGPTRKRKKKKQEIFAGSNVFEVSSDVFMKCKGEKGRYDRYVKHVGADETGQGIREYGRGNPGKGIIIKDSRYGTMLVLRRNKK
jgi:hypothetical protein